MDKVVLGAALAAIVGTTVGLAMSQQDKTTAPRWTRLGVDMQANTVFLDRSSIARNATGRTAWFKTSIGHPEAHYNTATLLDLTEFRCDQKTSGIKAMTSYALDNTTQQNTFKDEEVVFSPIAPDTMAELGEKIVCA